MLTDDPSTPGAGQWEINTAALEERTADARVTGVPHIDFSYGVGEHVQLKYETGYSFAKRLGGGTSNSGLDDSLLGLKWRFLDQDNAGVDASVYPRLELQNSHGSVAKGVSEPGPNLLLPVEVAHSFGSVILVGEVGYQYLSTQGNVWVGGILGAFQASKSLEVMTEVSNSSETVAGTNAWKVNVGLRQAVGPHLKLLASAGTGLRGGSDATRFIGYLGVQALIGNKE